VSFNISEFKSTLDKYGGPAKNNLFEMRINRFPKNLRSSITARDLRFFAQTASIPGMNINTSTYDMVASRPKLFPTNISNEPINVIFLMDSDHQVLSFFHSWMQNIINYSTSGGSFAENNDMLPYEVGYKDEYSTDISIFHYTTESYEWSRYETTLRKAFPVAIGNIDLGWEQNNAYLTLPVSFVYDDIGYSGETRGVDRSSGGLLGAIGAAVGLYDTVRQALNNTNRPTSVQDAVNRFTRITNSWDNLTDRLGGG